MFGVTEVKLQKEEIKLPRKKNRLFLHKTEEKVSNLIRHQEKAEACWVENGLCGGGL